jgi:regulator of chromosome condensation
MINILPRELHNKVLMNGSLQVYTWGCNDEGALGRVTTVEGSEYTAGLVDLSDEVSIVMVSAGDSHTVALSNKGTVYTWGTYRVSSFLSKAKLSI